MNIAESTIETYTAFKEDAVFKLRHCEVDQENYWLSRIQSYDAVIAAVRHCIELERKYNA